MKHSWILVVFILASLAQVRVKAQTTNPSGLSLGVIIGSITGFSMRSDLGGNRAFDAALAYSIDSKNGLSLHGDYLIDKARQFNIDTVKFDFYYGIGARLMNIRNGTDKDKTRVGIRAPFGIMTSIFNPDLDLFGELVPLIDVTPDTTFYVDVGLGVRYRF